MRGDEDGWPCLMCMHLVYRPGWTFCAGCLMQIPDPLRVEVVWARRFAYRSSGDLRVFMDKVVELRQWQLGRRIRTVRRARR